VIGEESWRAMCYEDVLPRDIRMVGDLFADKLLVPAGSEKGLQ
jgi:hypothetical protein